MNVRTRNRRQVATSTAVVRVYKAGLLGIVTTDRTMLLMGPIQLLRNKQLRRAMMGAQPGALYEAEFENPDNEYSGTGDEEVLTLVSLKPAQ